MAFGVYQTVSDVARASGIGRTRIQDWIVKGIIPAPTVVIGMRTYYESEEALAISSRIKELLGFEEK